MHIICSGIGRDLLKKDIGNRGKEVKLENTFKCRSLLHFQHPVPLSNMYVLMIKGKLSFWKETVVEYKSH